MVLYGFVELYTNINASVIMRQKARENATYSCNLTNVWRVCYVSTSMSPGKASTQYQLPGTDSEIQWITQSYSSGSLSRCDRA